MAGIKAKISNLLHKDKDHTHDAAGTAGTDYDTGTGTGTGLGTTTGTGTGLGTTTGTGYDSTRGEHEARTGISDLDINKGSSGTGLRSDRDTAVTGSEYGRTSGTGVGQTSTTTGTGYGTTGTGYGTTGDVSQGVTRSYDNTTNEIIDQERFTKTEDHEIVIEKKAYELEHRPVEKKYVVETKYMGEREVPGKATEILGTDAREVEERVVEMPRGDRTIIVENVDVPVGYESAGRAINEHGTTGTTGYSSTGQTGTGLGTSTGTGTGLTGQTGTGYGTGTGSSSDYSGTGGGGTYGSGTTGTGTGTGLGTGTGSGTGYSDRNTTGQQGSYGSDNRPL